MIKDSLSLILNARDVVLSVCGRGLVPGLVAGLALGAVCALPLSAVAQSSADSSPSSPSSSDAIDVTAAQLAVPKTPVMFIYDLSGSMWGELNGKIKHHIAREVVGRLTTEVEERVDLGLMAYGHRRKGDCSDIQTIVEVGGKRAALEANSFLSSANPTGKTPLTSSVSRAADQLRGFSTISPGAIVLLTDGEESCKGDPCALAQSWIDRGEVPEVHVVGFGLSEDDTQPMSCLAEMTGGSITTADDTTGLAMALTRVVMQAESKALRDQVSALSGKLEMVEARLMMANRELESSEARRIKAEQELESALGREVELKGESRDLWAKLSDKNVEINELEVRMVALTDELSSERKTRQEIEQQLTSADEREAMLLGEKEGLLRELSSLQNNLDQQLNELARMGDAMDGLQVEKVVALRARDEARRSLDEREAKLAEARRAAREIEQAKDAAEQTAAAEKTARLSAEVTSKANESDTLTVRAELAAKLAEIESKSRDLRALDAALDEATQRIEQSEQEREAAKQAVEIAEERSQQLQSDVMDTKKRLSEAELMNQRVTKQLELRQGRLDQLQQTNERRAEEIKKLLESLAAAEERLSLVDKEARID